MISLGIGIGIGMGTNRAAAATPITVVSVVQSGSDRTWNFSSAVTLTGANVPELENDFDGTGSWQSPDACTQGSATSITATYSGMPGELILRRHRQTCRSHLG